MLSFEQKGESNSNEKAIRVTGPITAFADLIRSDQPDQGHCDTERSPRFSFNEVVKQINELSSGGTCDV